jgi:hypothetical protein
METKWGIIRKVKPSTVVRFIVLLFAFPWAGFLRESNPVTKHMENNTREWISFIGYKY